MDSVDSGCTMGASEPPSNHAASSGSELIVWEIEVPKVSRPRRPGASPRLTARLTGLSAPQSLVGRLIGKQGRYVSYLKQNSGAKIYISTLPYTQEFQICHIEGESGVTAPPQTADLTLWCPCRYAGAGG